MMTEEEMAETGKWLWILVACSIVATWLAWILS